MVSETEVIVRSELYDVLVSIQKGPNYHSRVSPWRLLSELKSARADAGPNLEIPAKLNTPQFHVDMR